MSKPESYRESKTPPINFRLETIFYLLRWISLCRHSWIIRLPNEKPQRQINWSGKTLTRSSANILPVIRATSRALVNGLSLLIFEYSSRNFSPFNTFLAELIRKFLKLSAVLLSHVIPYTSHAYMMLTISAHSSLLSSSSVRNPEMRKWTTLPLVLSLVKFSILNLGTFLLNIESPCS